MFAAGNEYITPTRLLPLRQQFECECESRVGYENDKLFFPRYSNSHSNSNSYTTDSGKGLPPCYQYLAPPELAIIINTAPINSRDRKVGV